MRGGDEDQEELEEDQGSLRQPRHRATQPHLEIDFRALQNVWLIQEGEQGLGWSGESMNLLIFAAGHSEC